MNLWNGSSTLPDTELYFQCWTVLFMGHQKVVQCVLEVKPQHLGVCEQTGTWCECWFQAVLMLPECRAHMESEMWIVSVWFQKKTDPNFSVLLFSVALWKWKQIVLCSLFSARWNLCPVLRAGENASWSFSPLQRLWYSSLRKIFLWKPYVGEILLSFQHKCHPCMKQFLWFQWSCEEHLQSLGCPRSVCSWNYIIIYLYLCLVSGHL